MLQGTLLLLLLCVVCLVVWCHCVCVCGRFPCLPCSCFFIPSHAAFQTSCAIQQKESMPNVLSTSSRPGGCGRHRMSSSLQASPFQSQPSQLFLFCCLLWVNVTSQSERKRPLEFLHYPPGQLIDPIASPCFSFILRMFANKASIISRLSYF